MAIVVFRDLRLAGKFVADTAFRPVDENTNLDWIVKQCLKERGTVQLQFWSHGLPGYVQCGRGVADHPTAGPGITAADIATLARLAGKVTSIEFRCCLVARIGTCFECGGHRGYDGNAFCFRVAQAVRATVKASLHLQYGEGNQDCGWAGTVFTWNAKGQIVNRNDYPLTGVDCVQF